MVAENLLKYSTIAQVGMCLGVLAAILFRRSLRDFPALACFVGFTAIGDSIAVTLLFYRPYLNITPTLAYFIYLVSGWTIQVVGLCLVVMIIYGVFAEAMRPFPGLHKIGRIVFRWVGATSFVVAIALAAGPQIFAKDTSALMAFQELFARLNQGIDVLVLCLLIFVTFAVRPLGLTFRSRVFGVVLGLAIASIVELVQAAWLATAGAQSLYSPVQAYGMIGWCFAIGVWLAYFAAPEPARRMILLPTTSPFFLWNRISEVLDNAPGTVAIAGFTPSMLAPAEFEMLTAATVHEAAAERERERVEQSLLLHNAPADALFPELSKTPHSAYALQ